MADLHARFRALDAVPVPDLWPDIERRATLGAPALRLGGTTPAWRGAAPSHAANRRLVLLLVLLGLIAIALLGATLVGGILPDPLRADLPPAVPTGSPRWVYTSPTPTSALSEPAPRTWSFTSPVYGYRLVAFPDWTAQPASRAWPGSGPRQPDVVDAFVSGSVKAFSVVAGPVATDVDQAAWLAGNVPLPDALEVNVSIGHSHCRWGGLTIEETVSDWRRTRFAGYPAWDRRGCGQAVGAIFDGGVVYLFIYERPRTRIEDLDRFDEVMTTIDLTGGRPSAKGDRYQSARYGYTIEVPAGWTMTAAHSTWDGINAWTTDEADAAQSPGDLQTRLEVLAVAVEPGTDPVDWAAGHVPLPDAAEPESPSSQELTGRCHYRWANGSQMAYAQSWQWEPATVAGAPASTRGACSTADIVAVIGDTAVILRLSKLTAIPSNQQPAPDLELARSIANTLEIP